MSGDRTNGTLGGRYELGELLGHGGMADVRKATDLRLSRTVAVKMLRTDLAKDATFQARFRREAQSAASLNAPSVVAVYDTGEDELDGVPVPYIVMEYVEGQTLREVLHEGQRLMPNRALEITAGVLSALRVQPRARDRAPGHQAGQCDARTQRRRQSHGLRHRTCRRRQWRHHDADRQRAGNGAVPFT